MKEESKEAVRCRGRGTREKEQGQAPVVLLFLIGHGIARKVRNLSQDRVVAAVRGYRTDIAVYLGTSVSEQREKEEEALALWSVDYLFRLVEPFQRKKGPQWERPAVPSARGVRWPTSPPNQ